MKRSFNSYFLEQDITFPLTLSQAVWRLAFQRTENFKKLSKKEQYQIYKKNLATAISQIAIDLQKISQDNRQENPSAEP